MNLIVDPFEAALGSGSTRNFHALVTLVASLSGLSLTVFFPFFLPMILKPMSVYLKLVSFLLFCLNVCSVQGFVVD